MNAKKYQEIALVTMADQANIQNRAAKAPVAYTQLDNGIRGLTNEVGELADISKRIIEYGKATLEEKREHIKEEVGDCFWRLRQICDAVGLTFEECMEANINKLQKVRYPNGYSEDAAAEENRDREAERKAMINNPTVETDDIGSIVVGVRKALGHSYTRYCVKCDRRPVHKNNSTGICPDCYKKEVEPENV